MESGLKNKVAIVTGASRGIGRSIAQRLSAEGCRVVLVARSVEELNAVSATLTTESAVCAADLRLEDTAKRVVAFAMERFGRLDVLVNNAGATKRGDFLELSDADWQDGYALKLFGAMRLCRAAWPALKASGGSVINIAGIGGRTASAEFTIGGSVNSAVLNLTKALADRGVSDGVRVKAINPGSIMTDRLNGRIGAYAKEHHLENAQASQSMAAGLGISRFGDPEEVAHVVVFLASDKASYCQGAILDVDGGQTRAL